MNTTYFLNLIMGNLFRTQTTPPLPTTYYIGLSTTTPNIAGSNVSEPSFSGTGYTRISLSSLSVPSNGTITNTAAITFPESITDWGVVKYYVVYDAAVGGNLLFFGSFTVNRSIEPNTNITIKPSELTVNLRSES